MLKKLIALALAALLAFAALPAMAVGQVITNGSVNLRYGPGLDYEKLGAVKKGTMLNYMGETSTDDRGVDWYRVAYKDDTAWISSRYSELILPDPADAVEVSAWYLADLADAAAALGANDYAEVMSEVPKQYTNDALTVAGDTLAEYFGIHGEGYSLFGVILGMDMDEAAQRLEAAGLTRYDSAWSLTFQHPSDERSLVDSGGFDGSINVYADAQGRVMEIEWSSYTG